ncbi:putative NAD binding Rossmann fold oxidoreductase [Sphaerosporella brunnea]|uniref:Putative NAD binding Rossmann fold oxidoreductase n=1 Tax=Sphaerosporella brunnea TaxID=1250544 RepID=A0A5J5EGW1_9PEZI|nr:putative NAD binding Rossmann fold oxidoreductase [Sphaerosporella brunnea]KAA8894182.1 putative NAD binding Rossmann fold oxidoreductase [Sphaerosporella brunnea]
MAQRKLRVGLIGAGEVAQVVHLPALGLLSHLYEAYAITDISAAAVQHCAQKFRIPRTYPTADALIADPDVDVVFILTSDEFHAEYTIAALAANKHVMLEKPITLSLPSAQRMLAAEEKSQGRVFVGYMRRYAPSFTSTFLSEVATMPKIKHAFVRDIVGPNAHFVSQSGTSPEKFTDFPATAGAERDTRLAALFQEAFPHNQEITDEKKLFCRFLGSLGSHDLSLMREAIGFPDSVAGVSCNEPFYSAIFNYTHPASGQKFSVTYETGIDNVPRFDAQMSVFGEDKAVTIKYDTPYVKALPIEVTVVEKDPETGGRIEKKVLASYEDAYTSELRHLYRAVVEGAEIKTNLQDAVYDLKIFDMLYRAAWPAENWDGTD